MSDHAASEHRRPRCVGAKCMEVESKSGGQDLLLRDSQGAHERLKIKMVRVQKSQTGEQIRTRHNVRIPSSLFEDRTKGCQRGLNILVIGGHHEIRIRRKHVGEGRRNRSSHRNDGEELNGYTPGLSGQEYAVPTGSRGTMIPKNQSANLRQGDAPKAENRKLLLPKIQSNELQYFQRGKYEYPAEKSNGEGTSQRWIKRRCEMVLYKCTKASHVTRAQRSLTLLDRKGT